MTNVKCALFNTKVKVLINDGYLCTLRNVILASLLQHNEAIKVMAVEANMKTFALIQIGYTFCIRSDTFKEWGRNVKEQHEIMNKLSR